MSKVKAPVSQSKLLKKAQIVFNRWIRRRDEGLPCISCGSYETAHASHYFSVGQFSGLRFDEVNVNASCVKCNTWLHGNLAMYRIGLVRKYGEEAVKDLEERAGQLHKWDRETLENLINKYK